MSDSIWLLENRSRERKNGKWSPWERSNGNHTNPTAYRAYPAHEVFAHDKYERRAVEYVRKAGEQPEGGK